MARFKRPNDVVLRIGLIMLIFILSFINAYYIGPKILTNYPILEILIFSTFDGLMVMWLWFALKRPECECWDDIKPPAKDFDCMEDKP